MGRPLGVTSPVDVAIRLNEAFDATSRGVGATIRRIAVSLDVLVDAASSTATVVVLDEFSSIARLPGVAGLLAHEAAAPLPDDRAGVRRLAALHDAHPVLRTGAAGLRPGRPRDDLAAQRAAVNDLVGRGFRDTGRDPGPLGGRINDLCVGHPRRPMQAADIAWHLAAPGEPWGADGVVDTAAQLDASTADGNGMLFAH